MTNKRKSKVSTLRRTCIGLAGLALWLGISTPDHDAIQAEPFVRVNLYGMEVFELNRLVLHDAGQLDLVTVWFLALVIATAVAALLYLLISSIFRLRLLKPRGRLLLFISLAGLVFLDINPLIAEFLRPLPANRTMFIFELARTIRSLAALVAGLSATILVISTCPVSVIAAAERMGARLLKPGVVALAGAAALAVVLWLRLGPMQGLATVSDELSYLRQAEIFASGRLAEPSLEPRDFFNADQMLNDGLIYSKYPPGTSLCLAPFAILGIRQAGPPFFLACNLVLVFLLTRRLFGKKMALLSVLLAAASPFFITMGTGFLSHGPGLCAVLCMAYFHALWLEGRGTRFALLGGCFAGLLFLIRPVTALAVIMPFIVHGQIVFKGALKDRVAALVLFLITLSAAGGLMLLYNDAQTGSPFEFPYAKYAEQYTPYDRFGPENTSRGMVNTVFNLSRLNHWLFGFAPSLLLIVAVFLFNAAASWEILFGSAFLILAAAHVFHWFWGTPWYGPLYYYECAAFLVILSGRGAVILWERLKTTKTPAGGVLCLAGIFLFLFSVLPFHAERTGILTHRVEKIWQPVFDIRKQGVDKGAWVIFGNGSESRYLNAAPGWMTGGVRLLSSGGALDKLLEVHPDMKIYTYDRSNNALETVTEVSEKME